MYKITHKKTGFQYYFNSKETANFVNINGAKNYTVEEIKTIKTSEIVWATIGIFLMSIFTLTFIYYATN